MQNIGIVSAGTEYVKDQEQVKNQKQQHYG